MWITGVFGMATKYVEVYASVRYRVRDHAGNMLGGAMYVWERAFTRKDGTRPWWAKLGGIAFANRRARSLQHRVVQAFAVEQAVPGEQLLHAERRR